MFCPHCGVNNDRGEPQCFICHKPLPSLTTASPAPARSREPVAAPERFGSVGDRMLALFFDRIVLAGVVMALGSFAVSRWGAIDGRVASRLYGGAAAVLMTVFLYHLVFEGLFGTTLGKAIMGLQVRTVGDQRRFTGAAIRNLLRVIDALAFYLVGFFFAMFTARRQRIGDLVGRTVVTEAANMGRGARAAMMVFWLIVVGTTVWLASFFCPSCRPDVPWTLR